MTQNLRRLVTAGIFAIPFIVFLISSSMLFPFITGKNFTFRILVEILFVLWAMLAMRDSEYLPKRSWILYTYAIFLFFVGIADLFGENSYKSFWSNFERMEGFVTHLHLFLYFVVVSSVLNTKKIWNWFLSTWIGVSAIMSIYALLQLAGKITINQGGVRVDGTFGNATYLAVFMLFNIFFSAVLIFRDSTSKTAKWILGVISALQLVILYNTATRGAILGLIGGLILVGLIVAIWGKDHPKTRKTAIGTLLAILVLVLGFVALRHASFVQKSPVLARFANLSVSEIKTQGRYYIWPMAFKGIAEKPILGWGQENFSYIFSKYYNPAMYNQEQWFDRAHNMFIDWFVAGGLLVLIPYLALFYFFLWYVWKKDYLEASFLEKAILTGLMVAYMFQGIFVFDNLFSYILFFTVLAFVHSQVRTEKFVLPEWMRPAYFKRSVEVVLVVALVFTLYNWNIKPIRASQDLIQALVAEQQGNFTQSLDDFDKIWRLNTMANYEAREQILSSASNFLSSQVPQDIKDRYANMAKEQFALQTKEYPNDARSQSFAGIVMRDLGLNDLSLNYLKKANELSPTKQTIMFELGSTYIAKKDYQNAYEVFKKAYELDPSFEEAKIIYGIGAIYTNDLTVANNILSQVDPQTLLFDDRVVTALADVGRYSDLVQIFSARLATDRGAKDPQNFISLAVSYVQLGEKAKAKQVLDELVKIEPGYKSQVDQYLKQIGY